jgi:membrane-bound lytic murein transglycosylase D
LSTTATANKNFPTPGELESDVAFWVRVYTEADTQSGFIHDANNLDAVYETLSLSGQRRADEAAINKAKTRYSKILMRLANGRDGQAAEDQRILALWGSNVSDQQLRAAADSLRFQRGQSDRFVAGLERSGEWLEYIREVLAEKNLPAELAALPHVESSFNPDAYSSAGAAGIWQFTRSTGRRYLHIDYVLDERMDPFTATQAATQLLTHNHQLTGSWPLALTAYNHGAAGVRRAKKELGTSDIDQIVRNYKGRAFGFASRNFYVSFLAALKVSTHPERYFTDYKLAPPLEYAELEIPDFLLAESISQALDTDSDTLRKHNRALLRPVWSGKKRIPKGYLLRIPKSDLSRDGNALLAEIPGDKRFTEQTPDLFHKVVPGDTVSEISLRYGHSFQDIVAMNGLNRRYQIRVGQILRLPLEGHVASAQVNTASVALTQQSPAPDTPPGEDSAQSPDEPTLAKVQEMIDSPVILADPGDYTVANDNTVEIQATETLGHYAEWLDLRASQLRSLNGMPYGRPLVIGHRLKLDFSRIGSAEFELRRVAYQNELQQSFFMVWQIRATRNHIIEPGQSLWVLTRSHFKIPMWLLRQYNPDLDLDRLHPGTVIVIPELVET